MGKTNQNLCMGCMAALEDGVQKCPFCGHEKNTAHHPDCLPPGSQIKQYLIGEVKSKNGENAVYLAWDTQKKEKVQIKEFLPWKVCKREEGTLDLTVLPGCETRYKYFRASFEDINKTMMTMTGVDCLVPIRELIEEHNTIYVVYQYIETQTLLDYLSKKGGEELWCYSKKYLLPLYNGISNLHKKGVTHQGIWPGNILLDPDQHPYLIGFSISEVRTDQGELETELFPGYSAPEQYKLESWQGTWTDVYSLAAVTYRVLTGKEPPPALERLEEDKLVPAMEVDFTISENISDALAKGLSPEVDQRYQNVDDFTGKLLETVGSNTAVFQLEEGQKIQDDNPNTVRLNKDGKEISKQPVTSLYTVITMLVTLVVLIVFGVALYQQVYPMLVTPQENVEEETEPIQESTPASVQDYPVLNFVGQKSSEVTSNPDYLEKYYFSIKEAYSEVYHKGVIMSQSPEANTRMTRKSTVTLTVSKGSEMITIPDLYSAEQADAIAAVTQLGLQFKVVEGENQDVEAGQVFRTDPYAYEQVKKDSGETVILYVAKKEEEPVVEEPEEEPGKKIILNPRNRPGYTEDGE